MELLCDTDILSVFAKVKRLDLLRKAFPNDKFLISESVYDELAFSKEEGFDFPERIFKTCETVSHDKNEVSLYERWREESKYLTISKADLRTLIMAREQKRLGEHFVLAVYQSTEGLEGYLRIRWSRSWLLKTSRGLS